MKLSKAQQEVVDKMREGWELRKSNWSVNKWWLTDVKSDMYVPSITVRYPTAQKLKDGRVIELDKKSNTIHNSDIYRLTEDYKTKPE